MGLDESAVPGEGELGWQLFQATEANQGRGVREVIAVGRGPIAWLTGWRKP